MTFKELINKRIKEMELKVSELVEIQKKNYERLLKCDTTIDFLFIRQIVRPWIIEEKLAGYHNRKNRLKKFLIIKEIGSYIVKTPNGNLTETKKRADTYLKTDGSWLDVECTKEQIQQVYVALDNNDKRLFFETLLIITDNKSLTDRITKFFFGSSIKHNSKAKIKS